MKDEQTATVAVGLWVGTKATRRSNHLTRMAHSQQEGYSGIVWDKALPSTLGTHL